MPDKSQNAITNLTRATKTSENPFGYFAYVCPDRETVICYQAADLEAFYHHIKISQSNRILALKSLKSFVSKVVPQDSKCSKGITFDMAVTTTFNQASRKNQSVFDSCEFGSYTYYRPLTFDSESESISFALENENALVLAGLCNTKQGELITVGFSDSDTTFAEIQTAMERDFHYAAKTTITKAFTYNGDLFPVWVNKLKAKGDPEPGFLEGQILTSIMLDFFTKWA